MEENSTPQTPAAPQIPDSDPQIRDGHWVAILSIAVFVLVALGLTGFLYYQNQQLKSMLANYQTQVSPTPTATADPTANWKTYINDKYKFSFKYPSTLLMEINEVDTSNYVQLIFNKSLEDSFTVKASIKYPANQSKHLLDTQPIGTKVFDSNVWSVFKLTNNSGLQLEKNEVLYSIIYPDSTKTLVDQILSTFKFLGASPTPSAKACTQEAKLCPDGSYVGRTGANCEFAPCP